MHESVILTMRRLLQKLLTKPVLRLADRFSSRPDEQRVHDALSKLYAHTKEYPGKKGIVIEADIYTARFIVFSDQHKGAKDGRDDFRQAEPNYLAASEFHLTVQG